MNHLKIIKKKKEQLDALRPLDKAVLKNLYDWFKVETTYSSNALEGNSLTRGETALIVEKGITIKGKTINEHLEAINLAHAFDYIHELAQQKEPITLATIKNLHAIVLAKIDDHAGAFRKTGVKVSGTIYQFPDPVKVLDLMEQFETWLLQNHENVLTHAALAHLKLVTIHPFIDGNGRTARLLMNLLLIRAGYPPVIIDNEDRQEYNDTLEQAQVHNNQELFLSFIYRMIERSLTQYLSVITPPNP